MYRSLFLSILFLAPSADALVVGIEEHCVRSSSDLGEVVLLHSEGDFFVAHERKIHAIERYNVDEWLRPVKSEQLEKVLQHAYLHLVRASDGEFILHAYVRGLGGGVGGATAGFVAGKTATYVVCWGSIALVSGAVGMINPWAGKATFSGLSKVFAGPIEVLSNKVALGTSIGGAVITGPV